jgi:hypothetical protein
VAPSTTCRSHRVGGFPKQYRRESGLYAHVHAFITMDPESCGNRFRRNERVQQCSAIAKMVLHTNDSGPVAYRVSLTVTNHKLVQRDDEFVRHLYTKAIAILFLKISPPDWVAHGRNVTSSEILTSINFRVCRGSNTHSSLARRHHVATIYLSSLHVRQ